MAAVLIGRPRAYTAAAILALALLAAPAAMAQTTPAVHIDPAWLQADSASTTVELTLVAGMNGTNGGMNFNGASNGALLLTVPAGWNVVLHFRNEDQNMPHSAEVARAVVPVPVSVSAPAFTHAATHKLQQGMGSDSHEDVRFVADRAGPYIIYCAVPGHGPAGMWIRMEVSPLAARPSLTAAARTAN